MTRDGLEDALAETERLITTAKVQGRARYGGNHKSGRWPEHALLNLRRLREQAKAYRALLARESDGTSSQTAHSA